MNCPVSTILIHITNVLSPRASCWDLVIYDLSGWQRSTCSRTISSICSVKLYLYKKLRVDAVRAKTVKKWDIGKKKIQSSCTWTYTNEKCLQGKCPIISGHFLSSRALRNSSKRNGKTVKQKRFKHKEILSHCEPSPEPSWNGSAWHVWCRANVFL